MTINQSKSAETARYDGTLPLCLLYSSLISLFLLLQEVEPTIGERLCRLWLKIETEDDFSHSTIPSLRHSAHPHAHHFQRHMPTYSTPYPAFHHGYHPAMSAMMPDARSGRLLLPSSVVFPPPRLGHAPFFKARPWWGPPPPNFMPPHGPPMGMNHGPPPPHHHHHHPNSNYPHSQPGPPPSENLSSTAAGTNGGSEGPQNFPNPPSSGPSHSYSAFRNNLRTNPPPMSYSAKRLQQQQQQAAAFEKEAGNGSPPGEKAESNEEEAPLVETNQDSASST